MLLYDLVTTSQAVGATPKRTEKLKHMSALLRQATGEEVAVAVAYLSGDLRQRKIGLGYAAVRDARPESAAPEPQLTLLEVDSAFEDISNVATGTGSNRERLRLLRELFTRATADEQNFLARLVFGELRQGALEGLMLDAVARAADIKLPEIRRAFMLAGNLSAVAQAALTGGAAALSTFGIQLFRPLQPMLAQSANTVADAMQQLGTAALEYKLDGARIQVHKQEEEVRIYSRRLNEVTEAIPEIVDVVRRLPARELVLDGEVIALQPNGRPHDFQMTMKRFGRRLDVAKLQQELPLRAFFFDCLYYDGVTLIDQTGAQRFNALTRAVDERMLVSRLETSDAEAAQEFMSAALAAGHEGVVAKSLQSPYEAGRRGAGWIKVKSAVTLDLVVLGVEWGNGRRQGYLSNLHLGARDPSNGEFVMLGKTFKGMTDEMLAWQTREFLAREISRDEMTVYVRPEIVVEIAFDDIQASPRYPGGMALRFARVKGYRPDKRVDEADTIDTVRQMFEQRRSA
ncbi:MAG TPA: ATP-dependent DNA ligase [Longimicrobiales bacterium]|nr:ATP-dependent DNA ligase [Longimicrobiales bacterium]